MPRGSVTQGERIARLETENEAAKPLHEQFRQDIAELKTGQAEIQTTLRLLLANGHSRLNGRVRDVTLASVGAIAIAVLAAILRELGV